MLEIEKCGIITLNKPNYYKINLNGVRKLLRNNILYIIKCYNGIDTRDLIWLFKIAGIKPQKVCGHLSWLKRTGKIKIDVIKPKRCSVAF